MFQIEACHQMTLRECNRYCKLSVGVGTAVYEAPFFFGLFALTDLMLKVICLRFSRFYTNPHNHLLISMSNFLYRLIGS